MNTEKIQEVLGWLRGTDLVEVQYRSQGVGFSLSTSEGAPPPVPAPANRFTPVCSPAVGLFQWSEPGKPRVAEEGRSVEAGQTLGLVETAKDRTTPVKAPTAGRIARVFAEAGAPVEYGQPLFFLETA